MTTAEAELAGDLTALSTADLVKAIESDRDIRGERSVALQEELKRRAYDGDLKCCRACRDLLGRWHEEARITTKEWLAPAERCFRHAAELGGDEDAGKLAGFLLQASALINRDEPDTATTAFVEAMGIVSRLINKGIDTFNGVDLLTGFRMVYREAPKEIRDRIDFEVSIEAALLVDPKPEPEIRGKM